jgi:Uma2 family endonuclease
MATDSTCVVSRLWLWDWIPSRSLTLAVVVGSAEDYTAHPTSAVLVVEVADSSLRHDRRKASLYTRAEIPEYWILNLPERRLEVFRNPQNGAYISRTILHEGDSISPLVREMTIPVASLLPRTELS